MSIENELRKHIKAVVHPLKSGLELELALKAKLTKRELKLLKLWADGVEESSILLKMKLTKDSYNQLSSKLIKKLNQEKIKQVLYRFASA